MYKSCLEICFRSQPLMVFRLEEWAHARKPWQREQRLRRRTYSLEELYPTLFVETALGELNRS